MAKSKKKKPKSTKVAKAVKTSAITSVDKAPLFGKWEIWYVLLIFWNCLCAIFFFFFFNQFKGF